VTTPKSAPTHHGTAWRRLKLEEKSYVASRPTPWRSGGGKQDGTRCRPDLDPPLNNKVQRGKDAKGKACSVLTVAPLPAARARQR